MKILSQALPVPSPTGYLFPMFISMMRTNMSPGLIQWISVLHAMSKDSVLGDLPRSAPTTPGAPGEGIDYFTAKVLDSFVQAVDDESEPELMQPYGRPLTVPGSVDVSLVERYIPPSSSHELRDMWRMSGSPFLADRLVELNPNGGCLIFIYPTKKGGKTFVSDYLGPVLDPLLRSMVVLHGLSSDFSTTTGSMKAVQHLEDVEEMQAGMRRLCEELNRPSDEARERLGNVRSTFTIERSSAQKVKLERKTWSNWWTKQEKPRIRRDVLQYFRTAKKLPEAALGKEESHQGAFVEEILDSVSNRTCARLEEKIEVAFFIIRRTTQQQTADDSL